MCGYVMNCDRCIIIFISSIYRNQKDHKHANILQPGEQQIKKSTTSGAGADEVYTSHWEYFAVMDGLLRDCVKPRASISNMVRMNRYCRALHIWRDTTR